MPDTVLKIKGCRDHNDSRHPDFFVLEDKYDEFIEKIGKLLMKRLAAAEGDIVGQNGSSMTVPEGCCYVLGDNADSSYDSRYRINPFVNGADVVAKSIS